MFTVHNQQQHRLGISLKTAGFIDLKTWPQSFVKVFRIAGAGSSMTIAILLKDWNQPEIKASEQPQIIIGTKFSNNKTAVKQLTLTKLTRGECAKCTRRKSIKNAFYWSSKKESQV